MQTVTLTINGTTISARQGSTILETARLHDFYIPTLCHHEALRPIGACRLCQVEDLDKNIIMPSCVTKISPGMNISTDSPRILKNRKNIIRLLFASHPESCLVCDKGNQCELRSLAAGIGLDRHGLDPMPYPHYVMDLNSFLSRDLSKCILCAKCIRADQEVVCQGVIDYNFRGFEAYPAAWADRSLEKSGCTFCGTCLSVCPTGAISEKNKPRLNHAGMKTRGVCSYCACGCSIFLEHNHNEIMGIRPTGEIHTANGVSLCVRGHFGHDYLGNPERLATPIIRDSHGWRPISWDQAIEIMAGEFELITKNYGPDALGFMGGARSTLEECYLLQKLARQVFHTNNVDFAFRAQDGGAFDILHQATGFAASSSTFHDVEMSGVIMLVGANPSVTSPVLAYHIKRALKNGSRLLIIDPLPNELTPMATLWIQPRLGTDVHVLLSLLKFMLDENLVDMEFITTKTKGFDDLVDRMAGVDISKMAEFSDIDVDIIHQAAILFSQADSGFVIFGSGIFKHAAVVELTRLVIDLVLVGGRIGKDHSGLMFVLTDSSAQGALDMGIAPNWLPGQKAINDLSTHARLARIWDREPPVKPGLDSWGMIRAAGVGQLKGLFIHCENTVGMFPNSEQVKEALSRVSFLVVQDMFLTDTAHLAHLVLPSAAWSEKEGTVVNMEKRIQRLHQAVPPPGGFPVDLDILARFAELRGYTWGYRGSDDVLAEIELAAPIYAAVRSINPDRRAVFWPQPGLEEVTDTLPHGIGHADGRAVFQMPEFITVTDTLDPGFPYILIEEPIRERFGTGARSVHSPRLKSATPSPILFLSADDMADLELIENDWVIVTSSTGQFKVQVRNGTDRPKGVVSLTAGFPEVPVHQLCPFDWQKETVTGALKLCRVKLEPARTD